MTACLFALIGYLNDQLQTDEMHAFSGLGKSMPFFSVCFMMTCLASSGIPGFANFPAELLVFISSWKIFPFSVISGVIGVLLTAIYMIRAGHALCFGPENSQQTKLKDMPTFYEKVPFLLLLTILVFFGIFPSGILSIIQPAVERLL